MSDIRKYIREKLGSEVYNDLDYVPIANLKQLESLIEGYRPVKNLPTSDTVNSWPDIKDGDEFTVKCKVVKGKFELNLD